MGYVAYFDNQHGHKASCVGTHTDTYCAVSGLMCGTVYRVWVKALGQQYNSSDSNVFSLTSGKDIFRRNFIFSQVFLYMYFGAHALMFSFLSSLSAKRGGGKGQL